MQQTRTEMYQERLNRLGYSDALAYALSIIIFNCNSYDDPKKMTDEKLLEEIERAGDYLKRSLDKQLDVAKSFTKVLVNRKLTQKV